MKRTPLLAVALVLTAALTACGSTKDQSAPARLHGLRQTPAPVVATQSLPDESDGGADLPMQASPGGLLLVNFGYTSCPDVCPGTLAGIRIARHRLGPDGKRVGVAMVTVDPDRDTPEVFRSYLGHFFKDAHALRTTDPTRLQTVAGAFGVQYEVQKNAKGEVEVGHTALVFAVDDRGRIVDAWPFGMSTKIMTSDLRILLARADAGRKPAD